jgi:predicted amidohydrolase YtcJ
MTKRLALIAFVVTSLYAADAELILTNGKIITMDGSKIVQAIAMKDGRISATGTTAAVLANERGPNSRIIDLRGKTALPGLTDAHVHTLGAGLSEFRHSLPKFDSISAIQAYIKERARTTPKGAWIVVPRTLPPRLQEMRMPTRQDLDVVTDHPVAFDGSYVWSANSKALEVSGITRDTPNPPGGEVVKDAKGEPNGILRNASSLLKGAGAAEKFSHDEKLKAIEDMLRRYAAAGLTSVGDRAVVQDEMALFEELKSKGRLPIRVVLTWRPNASVSTENLVGQIEREKRTTNTGDEWLKYGSFKITLDGGQSVGTAYQRMPYGAFGRQLYGQTNPDARGTLFVNPEKLYKVYSAARAKGWQLTAHAQGGGAVDTLLDVFARLDRERPIRESRSHVMHGSFLSEEAIAKMKNLGVALDAQPDWLYFDVPALERVFGRDKMRWFFPLKTVLAAGIPVAGGSDHMIGFDKNNAVNPYNPFLNIWMCITRKMRNGDVFYPEERVTRQQALGLYTTGAAWIQFAEKSRGSLEPGKLADVVVIDRDYLTCPEDEIRQIEPLMTIIGGKVLYERK